MRVACIGEAMIELSMMADSADVSVAGDSLNTAVYLKREAPSIQVDYVTRLGTDPFSTRIKTFIASEAVGTNRIAVDPDGKPGLYAITVDDHGERSFTYWRNSSAARGLFSDGDFSVLQDYDVIYLSGISLAILPHVIRLQLIDFLSNSSARVVFDNNHRPRLWTTSEAQQVTRALYDISDILLPSLDDDIALFGGGEEDALARFAGQSGTGALKRGARGPHSLGDAVVQDYPPAPRIVDTTAAGDSFNGGYLAALLTGASQSQALMAGHSLAARVVGFRGAIIPQAEM